MASAFVDRFLRWWYKAAPTGPRVARVMVFDHDDRLDYLAWDPEAFRGEAWVDHVRETLGRDPARLEIRLVQGSKKRRVVLYPGMSCDPSFPPSARYIVINALLVPAPDADDATPVDVTSRVQKYVGNTLRSPMHMFPFDDPDELQRRFRGVKMLDLAMSVVDVPFPPSTDGGEKGVSG